MGQLESKVKNNMDVRASVDRVFTYFSGQSGNDYITFQELYTAVLLVYNDINKYFPGPHYDPPTREEVLDMHKMFDTNRNDVLDREEFAAFIEKFTTKVAKKVGWSMLIFAVAAPALALAAKQATENVPVVGKVVRRVPNTLYASLVGALVLLVENLNENSRKGPLG